jgi:SAM-dependent methyltransferase
VPDDPPRSSEQQWSWDPSLYAGSAAFYAVGRVPYPPELVEALTDVLALDRTGTLLDVGCGPGSLTLPLAPRVESAVGIDADPDMLAEAARLADLRGIHNITWRRLRAEQLPAGLPPVRLITLAQSFHWMDRPRVAGILHDMLEPGGALVHVSAETYAGADHEEPGAPPWSGIERLVAGYLGPARRAGQGTRPDGRNDEDAIYTSAGFGGPQRIEVGGWRVERSVDEVIASVHSLSWAAPHLFAERLGAFDEDLRAVLEESAGNDRFTETMRAIRLDIWR